MQNRFHTWNQQRPFLASFLRDATRWRKPLVEMAVCLRHATRTIELSFLAIFA
ncbi:MULTISPECIES: hypothetical protein [unclassified Nostoc]|uniref:hypothetical protein n=1 Tax=unclassified Nostoc TaxID=2593658 RepID=UPI002AD42A36|nr:hypothetical protein [Nostoc sp. DedQUE03]MDZ7974656.1 hypothetical protein [Nostoc sp. DedQUE03]MDZ8046939.1 hypothetical protein [Nostoc sp. DedQUE02]